VTEEIAALLRTDRALAAGLTAAYAAFGLTFRGPRQRFWRRMTATGMVLGSYALLNQPGLRRIRLTSRDVGWGVGSAAGLYGIFRAGDVLARRIMPRGAENIDEIYSLRRLGDKRALAARLAFVIGPAEELFWRGFVQARFVESLGAAKGAALGTAAYGGAHVVTGNPTLLGAATVAGGYWGLLASRGMSIEALIVSHVVWDVVIFLVAPTAEQ
jgi:hypothetical protein